MDEQSEVITFIAQKSEAIWLYSATTYVCLTAGRQAGRQTKYGYTGKF